MSQMTPASDGAKRRDGSARDAVEIAAYDITDAIEALCESAEYQADDGTHVDSYGEVPLTFGHLRAILAALSAPYVPGMREVDRDEFWVSTDVATALLSVFPVGGGSDSHYFAPAVTE